MDTPVAPTPAIYVGIDVSKATLDVAVLPTREAWQVTKDSVGNDDNTDLLADGLRAVVTGTPSSV